LSHDVGGFGDSWRSSINIIIKFIDRKCVPAIYIHILS
jgi:hypothetical protein